MWRWRASRELSRALVRLGLLRSGGRGGIPPHSLHCFSEQHHCCGLLQQDLAELCTPIGIASVPTVTVRPFSVEVRRWGRLGGGAGRGGFGSSDTAFPTAEGAEPRRLAELHPRVAAERRSVCGVFLRGGEAAVGRSELCCPPSP